MLSITQKCWMEPNQTSNSFFQVLQMTVDHSTNKQMFVVGKFLGVVRATWFWYLPVNIFLQLCCEIHSKWLHQVTHDPISGETPSARLYKPWWCKIRNPGSNAYSVAECFMSLCEVKVLLCRPGKYKHSLLKPCNWSHKGLCSTTNKHSDTS